eukprot:sb/3470707/
MLFYDPHNIPINRELVNTAADSRESSIYISRKTYRKDPKCALICQANALTTVLARESGQANALTGFDRYGMFNAEECYVYEHDYTVQTNKKAVVVAKNQSDGSFNVELDYMLDKYDSDNEDPSLQSQNDVQKIARRYYSGGTSGGSDWEKMVSSIADGALDMSGSHRRKQSKHSTKLRYNVRQFFIVLRYETKSFTYPN